MTRPPPFCTSTSQRGICSCGHLQWRLTRRTEPPPATDLAELKLYFSLLGHHASPERQNELRTIGRPRRTSSDSTSAPYGDLNAKSAKGHSKQRGGGPIIRTDRAHRVTRWTRRRPSRGARKTPRKGFTLALAKSHHRQLIMTARNVTGPEQLRLQGSPQHQPSPMPRPDALRIAKASESQGSS